MRHWGELMECKCHITAHQAGQRIHGSCVFRENLAALGIGEAEAMERNKWKQIINCLNSNLIRNHGKI